tara:strand:+ start:320 stop:892 length:573 start_codon:yes stop_codon:yes gene_type:complete
MNIKAGDFVSYSTLRDSGHARIIRTSELGVLFMDIRTGETKMMHKASVTFSEPTIADPKANMQYQIIDINLPEDDPEVAQVAFMHEDESVDDQEYILTITYDISFFEQPADPFCRDSDMDYYGYTECDAEVIQVEIHKHKQEVDGYSWGTGERVDNINVDDVMCTEDWQSIRRDIEANYVEYVRNIREEI